MGLLCYFDEEAEAFGSVWKHGFKGELNGQGNKAEAWSKPD